MKSKHCLLVLLAVLLLAGCGSTPEEAVEAPAVSALAVSGEGIEVTYTLSDLEALPVQDALYSTSFSEDEKLYQGVSLPLLLEDAGFDLNSIAIVKAVAADGYSKNYEPNFFLLPEATVAYELEGGVMGEEDGTFRLVFPGMEGEFSVRMLAELQVISG